jgi:mRNA interferase RelE/StbE
MPPLRIPINLKEKLREKDPRSQGALAKCFHLLGENPRHPGLRTSKIQGTEGVFEARASRSDRVSWEWNQGVIVILNHCQHDAVLGSPRG